MARRVRWARRASLDLEAIAEHIAGDAPQAAARLARQVLDAAAALEELPGRGRHVPELETGDLRELLLGTYRLIPARSDSLQRLSRPEGNLSDSVIEA